MKKRLTELFNGVWDRFFDPKEKCTVCGKFKPWSQCHSRTTQDGLVKVFCSRDCHELEQKVEEFYEEMKGTEFMDYLGFSDKG